MCIEGCSYPGTKEECPSHGERCPDCGLRGLHAADHYDWPVILAEE